MINNLILVGRVATKPKMKIFDDGTKVCDFLLAVDRPFKSQEYGKVEVDFFNISVWQGFADAMYTYCGIGSTIGIKGRIISKRQEIGETRINTIEIIGERVAFIRLFKPGASKEEIQEAEAEEEMDKEATRESSLKKETIDEPSKKSVVKEKTKE